MSPHRLRLPISTRHAFALAFDLAVRRDPIHSVWVPLLLRAPWIVAGALLPNWEDSDRPVQVALLGAFAAIGEFVVFLVTSAMLRFRAESVFNTPPEVKPAPVGECYARGLTRVPWLFATETMRSILLLVLGPLVLPAIFLLYRLSFATEAVVLREPNLIAAFRRSYRMTEGRFERWFELTVISVLLGLAVAFVTAMLWVAFPSLQIGGWFAVFRVLLLPVTTVIQYAWTFFFLRLVEIEDRTASPPADAIPPAPVHAAAPEVAAHAGEDPSAAASPADAGALEPAEARTGTAKGDDARSG